MQKTVIYQNNNSINPLYNLFSCCFKNDDFIRLDEKTLKNSKKLKKKLKSHYNNVEDDLSFHFFKEIIIPKKKIEQKICFYKKADRNFEIINRLSKFPKNKLFRIEIDDIKMVLCKKTCKNFPKKYDLNLYLNKRIFSNEEKDFFKYKKKKQYNIFDEFEDLNIFQIWEYKEKQEFTKNEFYNDIKKFLKENTENQKDFIIFLPKYADLKFFFTLFEKVITIEIEVLSVKMKIKNLIIYGGSLKNISKEEEKPFMHRNSIFSFRNNSLSINCPEQCSNQESNSPYFCLNSNKSLHLKELIENNND